MKKRLLLCVGVLFLASCAKPPTCNCEYLHTLVDLQQTTIWLQKSEIDSLNKALGKKKVFGKE